MTARYDVSGVRLHGAYTARRCPVRIQWDIVEPAEPLAEEESMPEFLEYRPRPRRGPAFRILRTDRGYRVVGQPPPAAELEEALRRIGVKRGAEIEVGGEDFEWH